MSLKQSESDTAPPPAKPPSGEPSTAETTRTAGRGGLAIAIAKVSFILFGPTHNNVFVPDNRKGSTLSP